MKRILLAFGTRPEAIKMAPVLKALQNIHSDTAQVGICVTAQHRHMLDQVLTLFAIEPEFDLNLMKEEQTLTSVTCDVLRGIEPVIRSYLPDLLLVHGDTTTTLSASLAAYYNRVRIGHVEAGLRTNDKYAPYPEEMNRKLTSAMTDAHFAPTLKAKCNLLSEGVEESRIYVTGNTVIDALLYTKEKLCQENDLKVSLEDTFGFLDPSRRLILVTSHRQESFGLGLQNVCRAVRTLVEQCDDLEVIFPVHLNPNVRVPVTAELGGRSHIHLIPAQEYLPFVYLMTRAWLIITDSGGIQEEAPALGKPVLVTRYITERPEAVEAGTAALVGTDVHRILTMVNRLRTERDLYDQMARAHNPFGDGNAARRIAAEIANEHSAIWTS